MSVVRIGRWLLAALMLAALCPPVRAENLDDAWGLALSVNQGVHAAEERVGSAEESLCAAKATHYPTLSNEYGYFCLSAQPAYQVKIPFIGTASFPIFEHQFFAGLSLATLPIYTCGRICNTVAAAEAGVHAAESEVGRTVLDLKLNVAQTYVSVLFAQRSVEVAEANVTMLEAQVEVVRKLLDQGLRARSDLLAAQVSLAQARQNALQARNQLDVARATYNRYLGRSLCEAVVLDEILPVPFPDDVCALTERAVGQRPELAGLAAQEDALAHQAKAVKAEACPQLAAVGGVLVIDNHFFNHDDYWFTGVAVSWDLDCGITKHRARALERRACATAADRADLEAAVALQVRQAWLNAHNTHEQVQLTRAAIDQAEENQRVALQRYRDGVGTNTEVLEALTQRTRAFGNYYNALYNEVLAVLQLKRAVGDL